MTAISSVNPVGADNLAASNFLVPNGTFVVELVIFVIVLAVLGWYVAPAVLKALADRDAMIERSVEEARDAQNKLTLAEQRYAEALAEARAESGQIKDTARTEGHQTLEELRAQARAAADEVGRRGMAELTEQRTRVFGELSTHVGDLGVRLASRVVGEDLAGDERVAATVSAYLQRSEAEH